MIRMQNASQPSDFLISFSAHMILSRFSFCHQLTAPLFQVKVFLFFLVFTLPLLLHAKMCVRFVCCETDLTLQAEH